MNDLMTLEHIDKVFPNFREGFRKAAELFSRINSFEDIETYLLRGRGLSPNTYRCYLQAVKQLYTFTDGLNPFQVTPGHIERFYDDLRKRVEIQTAYNRIQGLKKFFRCIEEQMPGYVSPFAVMTEQLTEKLNRTKQNVTKAALSQEEVTRLLSWLKGRTDAHGRLAYSTIFMLLTTGFRAAELCGLRWKDIETIDGVKYANGRGKGDKPFHQELFGPALATVERKGEFLFYALDGKTPLTPPALWYILHEIIGPEARDAGILAETRRIIFSPHLFRRTFATLLYKHGDMKLKALAEKTRHASIDTLIKYYVDDSEPTTPIFEKLFAA